MGSIESRRAAEGGPERLTMGQVEPSEITMNPLENSFLFDVVVTRSYPDMDTMPMVDTTVGLGSDSPNGLLGKVSLSNASSSSSTPSHQNTLRLLRFVYRSQSKIACLMMLV